jgi:hypothetical protein
MNYTIDEKIACLSREVGMRRRVYARQVQEGKMDASSAERATGIMAAILADYQAQRDAAQLSLFDQTGWTWGTPTETRHE